MTSKIGGKVDFTNWSTPGNLYIIVLAVFGVVRSELGHQ